VRCGARARCASKKVHVAAGVRVLKPPVELCQAGVCVDELVAHRCEVDDRPARTKCVTGGVPQFAPRARLPAVQNRLVLHKMLLHQLLRCLDILVNVFNLLRRRRLTAVPHARVRKATTIRHRTHLAAKLLSFTEIILVLVL
jgi:hypothetical protein